MAPEVEGVAQVVEWRQVGEYAAITDFVWLRRMNLVLDDAKKEGKGMCPCHQVVERIGIMVSLAFTPKIGNPTCFQIAIHRGGLKMRA